MAIYCPNCGEKLVKIVGPVGKIDWWMCTSCNTKYEFVATSYIEKLEKTQRLMDKVREISEEMEKYLYPGTP